MKTAICDICKKNEGEELNLDIITNKIDTGTGERNMSYHSIDICLHCLLLLIATMPAEDRYAIHSKLRDAIKRMKIDTLFILNYVMQ